MYFVSLVLDFVLKFGEKERESFWVKSIEKNKRNFFK